MRISDFTNHSRDIQCLCFDDEDQTVVTQIRVRTVEDAEIWQIFNGDAFVSLRCAFHPDVVYRTAAAANDFNGREEILWSLSDKTFL